MKFFGYLFISALLFSCQDLKREQQLKQLDQMTLELQHVQQELAEKKIDTIGRLLTPVMDVEFRIRNNFVSDTIAYELGKKINAYKSIRKRVRPLGKMYRQIEEGSKEELETLKKLKTDIESGSGDKTKYEEYLTFEQKKVDQLKLVLVEALKEQRFCMETFRLYHDELDQFSRSLVVNK